MADDASLEREPYLRRVLGAFERGELEPYEYTRRVMAINAAASTEQMARIVEQVADGSAARGSSPDARLDAVDLALLGSPRISGQRNPSARYVTLAVVFVMFAVLIGLGMWLDMHVHGGSAPSGVLPGPAFVGSLVPG